MVWPSASCITKLRAPCSTPAEPPVMVAEWRPVVTPSPPASQPISRTCGSVSSRKAWKMPMAFEPPPTQATTASGRRPTRSRVWARASSPMMRWKSRTIAGKGCGPATVPSK